MTANCRRCGESITADENKGEISGKCPFCGNSWKLTTELDYFTRQTRKFIEFEDNVYSITEHNRRVQRHRSQERKDKTRRFLPGADKQIRRSKLIAILVPSIIVTVLIIVGIVGQFI